MLDSDCRENKVRGAPLIRNKARFSSDTDLTAEKKKHGGWAAMEFRFTALSLYLRHLGKALLLYNDLREVKHLAHEKVEEQSWLVKSVRSLASFAGIGPCGVSRR